MVRQANGRKRDAFIRHSGPPRTTRCCVRMLSAKLMEENMLVRYFRMLYRRIFGTMPKMDYKCAAVVHDMPGILPLLPLLRRVDRETWNEPINPATQLVRRLDDQLMMGMIYREVGAPLYFTDEKGYLIAKVKTKFLDPYTSPEAVLRQLLALPEPDAVKRIVRVRYPSTFFGVMRFLVYKMPKRETPTAFAMRLIQAEEERRRQTSELCESLRQREKARLERDARTELAA